MKSLLRFPLDHVFHTSDFTLVELRRLERCGSDHFPILIELAYAPERTEEQKAPAEEPEDREHAKEILENAFGKGASDRPGPETPAPFKPT